MRADETAAAPMTLGSSRRGRIKECNPPPPDGMLKWASSRNLDISSAARERADSATCDSLPQIGPRGAITAGSGIMVMAARGGRRGEGDDDLNEGGAYLALSLLKGDDEL